MKGGSLFNILAMKALSLAGVLIVIGMVLIAVTKDAPSVAKLYGTTATVGGQSTGMFFASIPEFFANVGEGQSLIKPSAAPKKDNPKKAAPAVETK